MTVGYNQDSSAQADRRSGNRVRTVAERKADLGGRERMNSDGNDRTGEDEEVAEKVKSDAEMPLGRDGPEG
jgi:hypothetical protein